MIEELDEILLDQYHSVIRRKKLYKRLKKIMPNEPLVQIGEKMVETNIEFFVFMINNKQLLNKKHKKKKTKECDILARNPVYEWYRNVLYLTMFSYKTFMYSAAQYMSYFKKDNNEKT